MTTIIYPTTNQEFDLGTLNEHRDERQIKAPRDDKEFEKMCVQIYSETYHSPVRQYGRSGQLQSGVDLLFSDFRQSSQIAAQGMVLVQCKHTEKDDPDLESILNDINTAAKLMGAGGVFEGVYRFIVSTSAKNTVHLHNAVIKLRAEKNYCFEIVAHSWAELCGYVKSSDRLWDLYSETPNGPVLPEFRVQIHEQIQMLREAMGEGNLIEARCVDRQRARTGVPPVYGTARKLPPEDSWKTSPDLRSALIELYDLAADSRSSVELLDYEFGASRMQDADACLKFLLAYRVAGNLRGPDRRLLFKSDRPVFTKKLKVLADVMLKAKGAPDSIGTLALVLIMETDDRDIHDQALEAMQKMVRSAVGKRWELVSRVALAIVRFYYVRRWGWTPLARFYGLGDKSFSWLPKDEVGPDSPLLDQEFSWEEAQDIKVFGADPLAAPWELDKGKVDIYFAPFWRISLKDLNGYGLPMLVHQCRLYSAPMFRAGPSMPPSTKLTLSKRRTIDRDALVFASLHGYLKDLVASHTLMTTERCFDGLIGYRAVLMAYARRTDSQDSRLLEKIRAVENAIAWCRSAEVPNWECDAVWVVPVYDEAPTKLRSYYGPSGADSPFTLEESRLLQYQEEIRSHRISIEDENSLHGRYVAKYRKDPFTSACLLALTTHSPMLTFDWPERRAAELMGIGVEHPSYQPYRF